jgi:LuxR family transcriptional regulator of spore coat protein
MTDEEFVKSLHPLASCFETTIFWPGTGPARRRTLVTLSPFKSMSEGSGDTAAEAWSAAARSLRWKADLKAVKDAFAKLAEINSWAEFKAKFAEHAAAPMLPLTPRELEILQWLSEGKNCSEIATILGTAHSTVSHQANMMQHKLEAVTAAQAVAEGFRKGLLK